MSVDDGLTAVAMQFHHVHIYAKSLRPMSEYKALEARLNQFADAFTFDASLAGPALTAHVAKGREVWKSLCKGADGARDCPDPATWAAEGQDFPTQLLAGLGYRVTGHYAGASTDTLLVTSSDPAGVKYVISAPRADGGGSEPPAAKRARAADADADRLVFGQPLLSRFFDAHHGRPGIAVLAFEVDAADPQGNVDAIHKRYQARHPKLVTGPAHTFANGARILDVFAYYLGEPGESEADQGTVLRFVQWSKPKDSASSAAAAERLPLPGLTPVPAQFSAPSQAGEPAWSAAYSDHWVSNVVSRQGFLTTLKDTVGFEPKVNFNAGVVAAGEAQIESTVTGNDATMTTSDPAVALRDQSQIYLPTNNALSRVGHVAGFIDELGQGVQHLASRVPHIVQFIGKVNAYREMTGLGFAFLRIPRSYYGRLFDADLCAPRANVKGDLREPVGAGLTAAQAGQVTAALQTAGLIDAGGISPLDIDDKAVRAVALKTLGATETAAADAVLAVVRRSRFVNVWKLLRQHLLEPTYLSVVRNQILVDIQDADVLYQIFTRNILQEAAGNESPFLEFIQRQCSEDPDGACRANQPIRPGCGGFGIRNFLTLFLSIEVSKAMRELDVAGGDAKAAELAQRKIAIFEHQLTVSNPVLTGISDAMTAEGDLRRQAADASLTDAQRKEALAKAEKLAEEKEALNQKLMAISADHANQMKALREAQTVLVMVKSHVFSFRHISETEPQKLLDWVETEVVEMRPSWVRVRINDWKISSVFALGKQFRCALALMDGLANLRHLQDLTLSGVCLDAQSIQVLARRLVCNGRLRRLRILRSQVLGDVLAYQIQAAVDKNTLTEVPRLSKEKRDGGPGAMANASSAGTGGDQDAQSADDGYGSLGDGVADDDSFEHTERRVLTDLEIVKCRLESSGVCALLEMAVRTARTQRPLLRLSLKDNDFDDGAARCAARLLHRLPLNSLVLSGGGITKVGARLIYEALIAAGDRCPLFELGLDGCDMEETLRTALEQLLIQRRTAARALLFEKKMTGSAAAAPRPHGANPAAADGAGVLARVEYSSVPATAMNSDPVLANGPNYAIKKEKAAEGADADEAAIREAVESARRDFEQELLEAREQILNGAYTPGERALVKQEEQAWKARELLIKKEKQEERANELVAKRERLKLEQEKKKLEREKKKMERERMKAEREQAKQTEREKKSAQNKKKSSKEKENEKDAKRKQKDSGDDASTPQPKKKKSEKKSSVGTAVKPKVKDEGVKREGEAPAAAAVNVPMKLEGVKSETKKERDESEPTLADIAAAQRLNQAMGSSGILPESDTIEWATVSKVEK